MAARAVQLRLVDALPAAVLAERAQEVARANRAASELSPLTAQSLFAANVANALEGGVAAALPLDARRRLVASAVKLGIREFDAHLIIAMVQERARAGVHPTLGGVTPERGPRPDGRAHSGGGPLMLLALSVLLAGLMLGGTFLWLFTTR